MENKQISKLPFVEKYFHFNELSSTNDFAKEMESFPLKGIFIIQADTQTHGRGQRDNTFFSGEGGLYATVVCPIDDISSHFVLNRSIGLAVCEAIESMAYTNSLSIKWPNDILWNGKKLCGILLESLSRGGHHCAVGFGINVNTRTDQFPPMAGNNPTSMSIETGCRFDIRALLEETCKRFQEYCFFPSKEAHDRYRKRLYKIGSPARIGDRQGVFETVLEDGRLCLKVEKDMVYLSTGSLQFI